MGIYSYIKFLKRRSDLLDNRVSGYLEKKCHENDLIYSDAHICI